MENQKLTDAIRNAVDRCDPKLINEFFDLAIETNQEHLNLIEKTLTLNEVIHRQRVIVQGTLFLAIFNSFLLRS
jgi:hypothetical protein